MTKFMYKKEFFFKFRDEKQTFKSLMMKTELHLKLKDENNIILFKNNSIQSCDFLVNIIT